MRPAAAHRGRLGAAWARRWRGDGLGMAMVWGWLGHGVGDGLDMGMGWGWLGHGYGVRMDWAWAWGWLGHGHEEVDGLGMAMRWG